MYLHDYKITKYSCSIHMIFVRFLLKLFSDLRFAKKIGNRVFAITCH
jgi:hypothetical protein